MTTYNASPIASNGIQLFLVPDLIAWFAARKDFEAMGLLFIASRTLPSRACNCIRVDWSIKQFALAPLLAWNEQMRVNDYDNED